jgi:hypothetical protein
VAEVSLANTNTRPIFIDISTGGPDIQGSELRVHETCDSPDPGTLLGYLVGIPQVVPWHSSQFPEVVEASKGNGPALDEYAVEWFEKLIYVSTEQADEVVRNRDLKLQSRAEAFMAADLELQSAYSLGCGRTAPLAKVYKLDLRTMKTEELSGRYHALVDDFADLAGTEIKKMRIVPVGSDPDESLREFTGSNRHAKLKPIQALSEGSKAQELRQATLSAIRDATLGVGRQEQPSSQKR